MLRVKGVPLLYLPVMYYPLQESQRATGFLLPTYGTSTYKGQAISNGFFWAIERSRDLTLMHDWFTRSGQGFGGEYRYIANAQSSGSVKVYRFSRKEATYEDRGATLVLPANKSIEVQSALNHRLTPQIRARARVDYFSDLTTQQLYHQDIYQATRSTRVIDGSLSGTFGRTSMSAQYQRNEYLTGTNTSSVYGSTPRLAANVAPQMLFGTPIYASANTEYAFIPNRQLGDVGGHREVLNDSSLGKWDLAPSLRVPLSRLTYLSANTSASYRSTFYSRSLDADKNLTSTNLLRQFLNVRTEVIGPVLTKIWDTPESERTERMKHVIEPTFAVDYTTEFANQPFVPNTNDAADQVIGGAARVTYGITNRLFYRGRPMENVRGLTREFMTVGVQQSYYTDPLASLYDTTYVSDRLRQVSLSPIAVIARYSPTVAVDTNARVEYRRERQRDVQLVGRRHHQLVARLWQRDVQPEPPVAPRRAEHLPHRLHGSPSPRGAGHEPVRHQLGRGARLRRQPERGHDLHGAVLRHPGRVPELQLSAELGAHVVRAAGRPPLQRLAGAGRAGQHLELLRRLRRNRYSEVTCARSSSPAAPVSSAATSYATRCGRMPTGASRRSTSSPTRGGARTCTT